MPPPACSNSVWITTEGERHVVGEMWNNDDPRKVSEEVHARMMTDAAPSPKIPAALERLASPKRVRPRHARSPRTPSPNRQMMVTASTLRIAEAEAELAAAAQAAAARHATIAIEHEKRAARARLLAQKSEATLPRHEALLAELQLEPRTRRSGGGYEEVAYATDELLDASLAKIRELRCLGASRELEALRNDNDLMYREVETLHAELRATRRADEEREETVRGLQAQLQEHEGTISELRKKLEQAGTIATELASKDTEIAIQVATIASRDATIARQEVEVERLRAEHQAAPAARPAETDQEMMEAKRAAEQVTPPARPYLLLSGRACSSLRPCLHLAVSPLHRRRSRLCARIS